jgi:hypothetical protein
VGPQEDLTLLRARHPSAVLLRETTNLVNRRLRTAAKLTNAPTADHYVAPAAQASLPDFQGPRFEGRGENQLSVTSTDILTILSGFPDDDGVVFRQGDIIYETQMNPHNPQSSRMADFADQFVKYTLGHSTVRYHPFVSSATNGGIVIAASMDPNQNLEGAGADRLVGAVALGNAVEPNVWTPATLRVHHAGHELWVAAGDPEKSDTVAEDRQTDYAKLYVIAANDIIAPSPDIFGPDEGPYTIGYLTLDQTVHFRAAEGVGNIPSQAMFNGRPAEVDDAHPLGS